MKKLIPSLVFALLLCLAIPTNIANAETGYQMILPGLTNTTAAVLPEDGNDYVAEMPSPDTENIYFNFTVPSNTSRFYSLTVKNISMGGSIDVYIESLAGEELFRNTYISSNSSYDLNYKLNPGATYIIRIYNRYKTTGNIKLNLSYRDDTEYDTKELATVLKTNKSQLHSIDGSLDTDYYKFIPESTATYEFYFKNLSVNSSCSYYVYASSEEILYDRSYLYQNDETNAAIKLNAGDTYYIAVSSKYNSPYTGNYKVSVNQISPSRVKTIKVKKTGSYTAKVTWSAATAKTGYEVQVSNSKKFKTYDSYTTTDKSMNLSYYRKGTFYVRVRSYKTIGNTKYYGKVSSVKSFKNK